MKFKVNENETISECLTRMREEGYMPVKRIEKPIYTEDEKGNVAYLDVNTIDNEKAYKTLSTSSLSKLFTNL